MNYNLFDSLLDAAVVLDADKKIIFANEIFGQMTGSNVVRLIKNQTPFDQVVTFDSPPFDLSQPLNHITAATPYLEVGFKANGKEGKVAVTIQPFPPENMTQTTNQWIVFLRDVHLEETLQKKYKAELGQKEEVITELQKAKEQLQDYSKNLEKMVAERTAELAASNQMLNAMVNSLGQGFLVFGKDGLCADVYSKACVNLLEVDPKHKPIWEVLRIPENKIEDFKKWCNFLFDERIPFDDLIVSAPKLIKHSKFLHVVLEYYPIRDAEEHVTGVCLVATDKTSELEAQNQAKKEKALAERVLKLTKNKQQFWRFINETLNNLSEVKLAISLGSIPDMNLIFRLIHTLKGDAGVFRMTNVVEIAHAFETELDRFRTLTEKEKVDKAPYMLAEMENLEKSIETFLKGNRDIIGDFRGASGKKLEIAYQDLVYFHSELEKEPSAKTLAGIYEDNFLKEPISRYFTQYQDLMENIASRTRKAVKPLKFIDGDLKIYEAPHSGLLSSFVHIIRNSMDHGFEQPAERKTAGKDPECEMKIQFTREDRGGTPWIKIVFKDDGRGIDPKKIREKLASKGLDVTHENDTQVIQHVFDPGFSTASTVSEFSGRGMGMDAVQTEVKKLGGSCFVASVLGKGTMVTVEWPEVTSLSAEIQPARVA